MAVDGSARPLEDDAVLAAAAKVVAEHGWHDFTLERVAEVAGMSRTTLYRRGITKDLLVDALQIGATQAYQAALWPALTDSGTGQGRLLQALGAMCDVVEANLDLLAGMSTAPDPVFHLDSPDHGARDVYVAPLERLLADGVADGTLAVDDVADTAVLLLNVVSRTYLHLRRAHDWPPRRARDGLLALVLPALRTSSED